MKRKRQGFTLVETLAAVLILSLLTGVIAMGVSAGARIYRESIFVSESGMLSATLDTALGDILHYADCKAVSGGGAVSFENRNYGIDSGNFLLSGDGKILISPYGGAPEDEWLILVSSGAYASLRIDSFTLDYGDGEFFGGYTVSDAGGTREKTYTFAFRTLMEGA